MITDVNSTSPRRPARRRGATRPLTAVVVVVVVGLTAAACGSSPGTSGSPTTIPRSPAGAPSGTTKPAGADKTVVNAESNTTIGSTILVNPSGMTLYTLSADTGRMSTCGGGCATAWPPVTVAGGVTPQGGTGTGGTLATITRSDGSRQVTYNGQPLYTFAGDSTAGSTSGNGIKSFGGTWSIVKLGSATSPNSSSNTTAPVVPKTATTMAPTPTTTKAPSGGGYGY